MTLPAWWMRAWNWATTEDACQAKAPPERMKTATVQQLLFLEGTIFLSSTTLPWKQLPSMSSSHPPHGSNYLPLVIPTGAQRSGGTCGLAVLSYACKPCMNH
jgi:hypothetical protein